MTVEYEGPEQCTTLEQRNQQPCADIPKFDRLDNGRCPPAIAFAIFQVEDMNDCRFLELRVCPETSGRIAEFSEHEAD